MKKIDIHIHSLDQQITFGNSRLPAPNELRDDIFPEMGVEKGVLLPIALSHSGDVQPNSNSADIRILQAQCEQANQAAYELTQKYPGLLHWFCYLDPRMGEYGAETDFSVYLKRYKAMGAKGVGELTTTLYFDDPLFLNLFSYCEQYEMPVLFHISPEENKYYGVADHLGLPRLEKVLKKFPGLIFIGHSQVFWSEISSDVTEEQRNDYPAGKVTPGRVVELLRAYPNLYADLSAGSGYNALHRDHRFAYLFLEEFQDRLMFGSDYMIPRGDIDLAGFLDRAVRDGHISKPAYEKIIRGNAERILKL